MNKLTAKLLNEARTIGRGLDYRVNNIFAGLLYNDELFFTALGGKHINRKRKDISLDDAWELLKFCRAAREEQLGGKSAGEVERITTNNLMSQD